MHIAIASIGADVLTPAHRRAATSNGAPSAMLTKASSKTSSALQRIRSYPQTFPFMALFTTSDRLPDGSARCETRRLNERGLIQFAQNHLDDVQLAIGV
jgi:hypothetical protein